MNRLIFLTPLVFLLLVPTNVFASGIRYDSGEDATAEESDCWINGYDSGFAGKYDEDRAEECRENREMYTYKWTWDIGIKKIVSGKNSGIAYHSQRFHSSATQNPVS